MTGKPRLSSRKWPQLFLGATILLYGLVGFPDPRELPELDMEPAVAMPSCQYGGHFPNCRARPTCAYGGTHPNCNAKPSCPAGEVGTPPNCRNPWRPPPGQGTCPTGQVGTPPHCAARQPPTCTYGGTHPNCNAKPTCQWGGIHPNCNARPTCQWGGTYPSCNSRPTCAYGGTHPNCNAKPSCPAGEVGTPPNCRNPWRPPPGQGTCPTGQVGTPPHCAARQPPTCTYGGTHPNCNAKPTCQWGGIHPNCNARPTCQWGGTYPSCNSRPICAYGGTHPNCNAKPSCPAGEVGTPPNCRNPWRPPPGQGTCPTGQVGTPPHCAARQPPTCTYGGTHPNCNAKPTCQWGGIHPNCNARPTCRWGGTYPSCNSRPTCAYGGTYPNCQTQQQWEASWASQQHETVINHPGIDEEDLPGNPNDDSTKADLAKILAAMGNEPGFVEEKAQLVLSTLKPGETITRKKMSEILCAGLTRCTDDPDDPDDQISQLAESGITVGHTGVCAQRPASQECIQDYGADASMTNAQLVTFISRLLGNTGNPPPPPVCPLGWTGAYPDCDAPPPICPTGWTGAYPDCDAPPPECPSGWTGAYPDCDAPPPECPSGWTGAYPDCDAPVVNPVEECPDGWTGTYPDCDAPVVNPVEECPDGWTGAYPDCDAPVVNPVEECPDGWTGAYPDCDAPPPICPTGWTGAYPDCDAPPPICPSGWTGAYPDCDAPVVNPVEECPDGWTGAYPNCDAPVVNPPPCPAGLIRLAQHVDSVNNDDGCRPRTCAPQTRFANGWCNEAPSRPQNVQGTCVSDQITLTWDAPEVGTATSYLYGILRSESQEFVGDITSTSQTSVTIAIADTTITYAAVVQARNSRGSSPQVTSSGFICTQPAPSVSFNATTLTVAENSSVQITATLDAQPSGTASVRFTLIGATNGNGSCSAGADFYVSENEFTFTNTTSASITLTACDDTDTTDETVTLALTTTGISGLQLGSPTTVVVTVIDDTTACPPGATPDPHNPGQCLPPIFH